MGRIKRSWVLTKKSWGILRSNQSLLMFPMLSLLSAAGAILILAAPTAVLAASGAPDGVYIAIAVFAAYLLTFVAIFFNVGLAGAVSKGFDGEPVTVSDGIAIARERVGAIAAWALISTTVGLLLRLIEERVPLAGKIAVWLIGTAWAVITYFVVPVLALEGVDAGSAIKRSASVFKQRWGEEISGQIIISAAAGLFVIPAVMLTALGIYLAAAGSVAIGVFLIAVGFMAAVATAFIFSAMTQIFGVALYRYATERGSIGPFSEDDLQNAFARKRRGLGRARSGI